MRGFFKFSVSTDSITIESLENLQIDTLTQIHALIEYTQRNPIFFPAALSFFFFSFLFLSTLMCQLPRIGQSTVFFSSMEIYFCDSQRQYLKKDVDTSEIDIP